MPRFPSGHLRVVDIKMAVCAFMVIAGFGLFDAKNLIPFAPMGVLGIARGASSAFFGYTGFEEVRRGGAGGGQCSLFLFRFVSTKI